MQPHQILLSENFGISRMTEGEVHESLKKYHFATYANDADLIFIYSGGGDCYRMDGLAGSCFIGYLGNWYSISTINVSNIKSNIFLAKGKIKLNACNGEVYIFDFQESMISSTNDAALKFFNEL